MQGAKAQKQGFPNPWTTDQVKNWGPVIDANLNFDSRISSITGITLHPLRNPQKDTALHPSQSLKMCPSLVKAFHQLALIENTVDSMYRSRNWKFDHFTPVLWHLLWLPVVYSIDFKSVTPHALRIWLRDMFLTCFHFTKPAAPGNMTDIFCCAKLKWVVCKCLCVHVFFYTWLGHNQEARGQKSEANCVIPSRSL